MRYGRKEDIKDPDNIVVKTIKLLPLPDGKFYEHKEKDFLYRTSRVVGIKQPIFDELNGKTVFAIGTKMVRCDTEIVRRYRNRLEIVKNLEGEDCIICRDGYIFVAYNGVIGEGTHVKDRSILYINYFERNYYIGSRKVNGRMNDIFMIPKDNIITNDLHVILATEKDNDSKYTDIVDGYTVTLINGIEFNVYIAHVKNRRDDNWVRILGSGTEAQCCLEIYNLFSHWKKESSMVLPVAAVEGGSYGKFITTRIDMMD